MDSKVMASQALRTNVLFLLIIFSYVLAVKATVSYDNKAILIDGKRRILISGSIHYPRSTPEVPIYANFFFFFYTALVIYINMCVFIYSYVCICVNILYP